ncbi:hypothetical protein COO91_04122 [Nostoc flagelliforme CCNUN1]|uniref:Uncharacterized protein n=1 Tax=Nostoc flagelliforme CCNUN1 TaxID=2038116 RepID=A0A2K8SRV5_9NOSO|nr:hypothetical protein COO91_04122 [Nostoc flagelliforme CCNUN1]
MLTPSVGTPNFSQIHSPQNLILPEILVLRSEVVKERLNCEVSKTH